MLKKTGCSANMEKKARGIKYEGKKRTLSFSHGILGYRVYVLSAKSVDTTKCSSTKQHLSVYFESICISVEMKTKFLRLNLTEAELLHADILIITVRRTAG